MSRSELRWCLSYGALLAALTGIPYAAALASQGSDWEFTGAVFAVEDTNSYIAKMRLGAAGEWLFRTPYSARPPAGIPAFLPYLLLGKLAGPSPAHRSLLLLYHAMRTLAVPLAAVATYRFHAQWIESVAWRRWATVLATLGGGLGWALLLAGVGNPSAEGPLEFYSPEAFGFLSYYGIPHLLVARAMLLLGVCWMLQAERRGAWGWRSGMAWLGLAVFQPLALAPAAAAVVAHGTAQLGARRQERAQQEAPNWLKSGVGSLILPAPLIVALAIAYGRDPTLRAWAEQNLLPSPPLWYYLASYLPLLPLAGFGAWRLRSRAGAQLLILWPLFLIAMAYAPVAVQRRLIEGLWVALVALAAIGLEGLAGSPFRKGWIGRGVLTLCLPATVLLLVGGLRVALAPARPAFRPFEEASAFRWLGAHAPSGSVALAAFETGNALPAWAPLRVVIGHGPETANLKRLGPAVDAFFSSASSDMDRRSLLAEQLVTYVFHGPLERELGRWDPAGAEYLVEVYRSARYAIFRSQ